VATSKLPTLEDLRIAASPAWLWDGARGRVVWANQAGLLRFDCKTLFDLIDRPFDAREAGIEVIAELTSELKRGESRNVLLHFPSIGLVTPLSCQCNIHNLADGRPGLLVVEGQPEIDASHVEAGYLATAFAQMPMACAFMSENGKISKRNHAADDLFQCTDLNGLLGDAERALSILRRLETSSLVSTIEMISGRLGQREVRLTLQKLQAPDGPFAMVMLDDVTERRNAERLLTQNINEPPHSSLNDGEAFEALAQTLKASLQHKPEPQKPNIEAVTPKSAEPIAPKQQAQVTMVPKTIASTLEQTGFALAIGKDGKPAFVTRKAIELFSFKSAQDFMADTNLWASLSKIGMGQSDARVKLDDGRVIGVSVKSSSIPWLAGPAHQYVFEAYKAETEHLPIKAKAVEVEKSKPVEIVRTELTAQAAPPLVAPERAPVNRDLERILDIASDGIVTLDNHANIKSFSAGAEAIFGYRTSEVLGKPFADLLTPESHKSFGDYLASLEGPGLGAVFNDGREMTAIVKQGGTVPLFFTLGRLQSDDTSAGFAAVMRDITQWKRTEKELRDAKDVAEESSRQKSEFLARISHELRTPLNAIIGFSEVMRLEQFGALKNEKYRGYVNDIHASGGYLLSLINDLLDLSKIEAGKMELDFTAVSIVDATEHAMRLLQDTATRGRILVRKSFAEKLPRVVADQRALRQVMLNILSNAIKFTDPGGQVIVSAQVNREGQLSLSVKDSGIGMSGAQIAEALQPFTRIETVGRDTQGTGLGLSLTKALVEANRAKFAISSEPGRGTLVEVVFPTTRVLAE
jgi:PAS domain S-box-containing protein